MRLNLAAAAASAALLAGQTYAEESSSSSAAESATAVAPELPTFTVGASSSPIACFSA